MTFSANLGFLWTDLPLVQAIHAAKAAGFAAVECHWPYATPPEDTAAALRATGLPMLALNTSRGGEGDFGLAALPDRQPEARAATLQALRYAEASGTNAVHVMAGIGGEAACFHDHLGWAADQAHALGLGLLIEPINPVDVPGYHLNHPDQAAALLDALDRPHVRLMLDFYHIGRLGLDPAATFARHRARLGHLQIAAVPDRGPPDHGEIDYAALLPALAWPQPIGAEYRPGGPTDASLGWLDRLSSLR